MERESFEDDAVAKLLNDRFVSIKVDREERPDIDSIYMTVCQMMTGHGGWPMSVFMTPDRVPFYAGTYFPKEARYGYPGFKELIVGLSNKYQTDPDHIKDVADSVMNALRPKENDAAAGQLSREILNSCYNTLEETFDPRYGGFGQAPKFPMPHSLMYLLRYYRFTGDEYSLDMVTETLESLANGGIYDHIGFGFSRYSVDEKFLVPHFEKMLYDNALLTITYTEAYQITKEERFQRIAEQILSYVLRDMQHSEGGFYSAEDADSEGVEGKFYLWTIKEIKAVLGEKLGTFFCQAYDITETGNFEGKNIPNLIGQDLENFAATNGIDFKTAADMLEKARQTLFQYREKRVHPYKDDKILTSWNGLMIAALAKAGRVFQKEDYISAAEDAMKFIQEHLIVNGRLMVRYRDGEVKHKGFIDEYAFILWALIELYECTLNLVYLEKAKRLAGEMLELFWDEQDGGFFFYGKDSEELLVRQKEAYDGAIPSGNGVAAMQMVRLARLTGDFHLEEKVQSLIAAFAHDVTRYPTGHTFLLQSYLTLQMGMKEVVVVGTNSKENEFVTVLQQDFYPELTYLVGETAEKLAKIAPFTKDYQTVDHQPTVYVCENFICHQPTIDTQAAIQLIRKENI